MSLSLRCRGSAETLWLSSFDRDILPFTALRLLFCFCPVNPLYPCTLILAYMLREIGPLYVNCIQGIERSVRLF